MSILGNFYTKAKKKLTDTLGGLGDVANTFRNSLNDTGNSFKNTTRSVMDYSAPKFKSFNDNYVKPMESFVQKNPTPYSYVAPKARNYFKNDATVGGMAKNTVLGIPKAVRTTYNATKNGDLGKTISDNLEQFDYFKPTKKVRTRDFVRELPLGIDKAAQGVAQDVIRFGVSAAEVPKTLITGKASQKYYDTPVGRVNSFQSEAQNRVERGDPLWKAIGNPAMDTVLAAGDVSAVVKPVLSAAKNLSKFGKVGKEVSDVAGDLMQPMTKKVKVPGFWKTTHEPVPGVYAPGGVQQMRELPTPILEPGFKTETVSNPFKSKTLKMRPGLNIEDVSGGKPSPTGVIPSSAELDARIAQKTARAKELVGKQMDNQKVGLDVAESGFVAPQAVVAPKKTLPLMPPEAKKYARQQFQQEKVAMGESLSFFDGELDSQYAQFRNLYNRFSHGKAREAFESMDPDSIKKALAGKVSPTEIDNILYSQDKHPDEILDMFLTMNNKEKNYKNLKFDPKKYPQPERSIPPIDEFVNGKSSTPQMPDDIKRLQEKVDNGEFIQPQLYAKLMGWHEASKKPIVSIGEFVNGKTAFDVPEGGFNRFQQNAFDQKGERIAAIGEVLNYPNELRRIGYKRGEIDKIGKEQAGRILKLAELGFPKNAMPRDLLSDQVNRIIKNKVTWTELKSYYQRKNALNTNFLEGIDPKTLEDINPMMVGGRDVYRNFEVAFGKNYPKIKKQLLDPFDSAKGNLFSEQEALTNEVFEQIVKKLGIVKGSDADKAVVGFGEGKISLQQLQKDFPKDWQKIVDADQWFRNKYPELLSDLNAIREANFPTHPLFPESTKIIPQRKDYYRHGKDMEGITGLRNMFEGSSNIDPALAASSDVTNPKTKWLSFAQKRKSDENDFGAVEGYLDYIKNHSYAKHIDPFIQKFKGVDDEAKDLLPQGAFSEANSRIGLAEELSKKMDPVQQITESTDPARIKQILIDKEVSEPQAEWMSKELATISDYEKTQAFLKNKLAKNTGKQLENLGTASSPAEKAANKENNFLVFIKNFSRDLAGKTNPIDRPFQENMFGRKALSIISWANSRFKANAVLGNVSSSLAQFFNIPQGFASAGARNSAKGLGSSLAGIFKEAGPIKQSSFIRERYFKGFNQFDTGVLADTKKFAVWMTGIGDKIGTKFIWNSHYQKALSEGIADPIKYADDWTRRMVAGRGIGEVPILQKSKITQLVAPFQLEVANQWYALRDIVKNDPRKLVIAKKMLEFSVASFVMNRIVKEIRGSDVSFDPINAMMEAYGEFQDEDDKIVGSAKAFGRASGEVVSNVMGGQTLASMYPEFGFGIDKENFPAAAKVLNIPRKDFFGEGDPTRFGTGGLPLFSAIKNPLTGFVTPYGGKQIEKTYSGAKSLMNGYVENNSGKVMTPVNRDVTNVMKGVLFGKNAFGEMQNYFDTDQSPLSDLQTEKYKLMGNDQNYFNKIANERKSNKEKEALKTGKASGDVGSLSDGMSQLSNGSVYVKSLDKEFKTVKEASMAIAMDDLANSDGNFIDLNNGWVLRKGEDGNVVKQRRDSYDSGLNTAKLSGYKKNENLESWKETADKQLALFNKMIVDPSIDDFDKAKIQNAMDTLIEDYQKFSSYGGFTKPKKGRAVAEKFKYPLVDPEFMRIQAMIAGTGGSKFRRTRRPLPLVRRRLPLVRRTRRA